MIIRRIDTTAVCMTSSLHMEGVGCKSEVKWKTDGFVLTSILWKKRPNLT